MLSGQTCLLASESRCMQSLTIVVKVLVSGGGFEGGLMMVVGGFVREKLVLEMLVG